MASGSAVASCREIASKPADARLPLYEQLITQLIQRRDSQGLLDVTSHLIDREGSDPHGRTYITPACLTHMIKTLKDPDETIHEPFDVEDLTPLVLAISHTIRSKADDYAVQMMEATELLSDCYRAEGDYSKAAYTLSSYKIDDIKKESLVSPQQRCEWFVRCAELFLAVNETGMASQQIKRAHGYLNDIRSNASLTLRFKTAYARTLDSERKFNEAAMRYYELSQMAVGLASESDLMQTLQYAVTCAILSKAGPSRHRILALLYSDERSHHLANFDMLESVYMERLIAKEQVNAFESLLTEHQKAETSTGRSVLTNAIIEHNISATARLFTNITFTSLSTLLDVSSAEAELICAAMIQQKRLNAYIDQTQHRIIFQRKKRTAANNNTIEQSSSADVLNEWDQSIEDVCNNVNRIVEEITKQYPQYIQL